MSVISIVSVQGKTKTSWSLAVYLEYLVDICRRRAWLFDPSRPY